MGARVKDAAVAWVSAKADSSKMSLASARRYFSCAHAHVEGGVRCRMCNGWPRVLQRRR